MWQESKCQGSVLLHQGFTHYLQIFVKYGKVCWNFSDFIIDGSRIMTSSQGKKVVWTLRRNLGPDWVAWHRVSLKSGILGTGCWLSTDLRSRWCGSLPWKCGSESRNLPWRYRVSLICRCPLKAIIKLFNWLIRIQTHDGDFNFHKHKIMMWLLWQWVVPLAAV